MTPPKHDKDHPWAETFPILAKRTYMANHTLGAVPARTLNALAEYHQVWAEKGIDAWESDWWDMIPAFSGLIERVLNAPEGSVVPLQTATRATAAIASCFDWREDDRRGIVLTDLEFSTSYPFWRSQERLGAELTIVESEDGITVDPDRILDAVDETTLMVATCHVYYQSGAKQDLRAIADGAHQEGAYLFVDGYHAPGIVPVDVQAADVDFYVGGSHKWLCGGPGAAFLHVRPELIPVLEPRLTGWFGQADPFRFPDPHAQPDPHPGILRFQAGTPNIPALYAAREGVKLNLEEGADRIFRTTQDHVDHALDHIDDRGLETRTVRDRDARSAMVSFQAPKEVEQRLLEWGFSCDWRPDCGVRFGAHWYNTSDDIDRFFEAVDLALKE